MAAFCQPGNRARRLSSVLLCSLLAGCVGDAASSLPTATPAVAPRSNPQPATAITGRHDFGAALTGSTLVHEFSVMNSTKQTWDIASVDSTCGCTTARPVKSKIEPGESLLLPVQLSLLNQGHVPRPTRQRVTVRLADSEPMIFEVLAIARPEMLVNPASISQTIAPGSQTELQIAVENSTAEDWQGLEIADTARNPASGGFRTGVPQGLPVDESSAGIRQRWIVPLTITTARDVPGELSGTLDVVAIRSKSDPMKASPRARIPYRISALLPVKAIPESVFLPIQPGQPSSRTLMFVFATADVATLEPELEANPGLPCEVSLVRIESSAASPTLRSYQLTVTCQKPLTQTLRDRIRIRFGPPLETELELPLTLHPKSQQEGGDTL